MPLESNAEIAQVLRETRTIALVGASDNPARTSFRIMEYLQGQGYRVIPVNPRLEGETINGEMAFAKIGDIPVSVDMADFFINAARVGPLVDEAIEAGVKTVWMQLGVIDDAAADRAEQAGLNVVMDRCPKIEIPRLGVGPIGALRPVD